MYFFKAIFPPNRILCSVEQLVDKRKTNQLEQLKNEESAGAHRN